MKKTELKRLGNIEKVSKIVMRPTACVLCQIGKDWYQCRFEAEFLPGGYYPDYMQVERFVMDEIDGKTLNIEQAARLLYDFLSLYEPKELRVRNHVTGCKSHFDVDVTIG